MVGGRPGVHVAGGRRDEDAGEASGAGRLDLAGHRASLVGQVGRHGATCSGVMAGGPGSAGHPGHGGRGDHVDLDPVLGARHGQAAGEADDAPPWRWRTTCCWTVRTRRSRWSSRSGRNPEPTMWGQAARAELNEPSVCTARWRARLASSTSGKPAHRMMPALLTRMSIRPKDSTAASTTDCAPPTVASRWSRPGRSRRRRLSRPPLPRPVRRQYPSRPWPHRGR